MKKPLGQHFIFDRNILGRIIDRGMVTSNDTVIEIGAGPGIMTSLLAERAGKVIALEIDSRLIEKLNRTFSDRPNVKIIKADALKFPYGTLGKFKVVANIPYYITTPIIFKLLEFKENMSSMTLLVQKEIARRIVASPGKKDYGVLSITTQLYTKPSIEFLVPKGVFSPPPKVDSAVVRFVVSPTPLYNVKNERLLVDIVKTAFSQRRKTIANSLKPLKEKLPANSTEIIEALNKAGIDPGHRPEVISISDYIKLSEAFHN